MSAEKFGVARVVLQQIAKSFHSGSIRAVRNISVDIGEGELVVLVGPSGCGKTTTLRLVAGLETLDAGTILIGNRDVANVAPRDRDVAMVFQDYALYTHRTVHGNLAFGLQMRRMSRDEVHKRVTDVADALGLAHLLDRKPASLSGGERRRVALGRAIVRRPSVFLFDEPLSNLDAGLRARLRTLLKTLHQESQTTTMYVTHDQQEAMTLGDRLFVMRDGAVLQCGTPLEVYGRPSCRFVAGLVGSPPMNLWEGRLEARGTQLCFRSDVGEMTLGGRAGSANIPSDRRIVLGVRPEHLCLAGTEAGSGGASPAGRLWTDELTVLVVEPLGDRQHVHLATAAGTSVTVQIFGAASIGPGERARLHFSEDHVHLFRADGAGERLD